MNFRKTAALFAITGVLTFSISGATSPIPEVLSGPKKTLSSSGPVSAPLRTVPPPASELPIIIAEGQFHGIFVPTTNNTGDKPVWRGVDEAAEFTDEFLFYRRNRWNLGPENALEKDCNAFFEGEGQVPENGIRYKTPKEKGETRYLTIISHAKAPYFTNCRPTPGSLKGDRKNLMGQYDSLMQCVGSKTKRSQKFGAEAFEYNAKSRRCVMYKGNVQWVETESHKKWGCVIGLTSLPTANPPPSTSPIAMLGPVTLPQCAKAVQSLNPNAVAASMETTSGDKKSCYAQFGIASTGRVSDTDTGENEKMAFIYNMPPLELPIIIAEGPIHGIFVPLKADDQEEARPIWRGVDLMGEFTNQILTYEERWWLVQWSGSDVLELFEIGGSEARVPEDGSQYKSATEGGEPANRTIIHHAKAPYFTTCRPTPRDVTGDEDESFDGHDSLMECVSKRRRESWQFGAEAFSWDPEDTKCVMYKGNVKWATTTTKKWGCIIGLNPLPTARLELSKRSTEVQRLANSTLPQCVEAVQNLHRNAVAASMETTSDDKTSCYAQFGIASTGRVSNTDTGGENLKMAFIYNKPPLELPIIIAEGPINGFFVPLEEPLNGRAVWRHVDETAAFTDQFLFYNWNRWNLADDLTKGKSDCHAFFRGKWTREPVDGSQYRSLLSPQTIHHAKAPYFTNCRPTPGSLKGANFGDFGRHKSLMKCVGSETKVSKEFGAEGFQWDPESRRCVMYKGNFELVPTTETESNKKWACVIRPNPLPSKNRPLPDSSKEVSGLQQPVSLPACIAEVRSQYPAAVAASILMESEDNNQCFAQFEITSTGRVSKDGGNELMAFTYANPTATEKNESEEMQL